MDGLVSGYGVANTLTRVDKEGKYAVRIMNPHAQTISILTGSQIGVTSIPTGIESRYPVATALIADQCGKFGATKKALRIAFSNDTDWETSLDEEVGKVPTPEDLQKAWGGPVPPHLVQIYEKACRPRKTLGS